jgi:tripartite-type tricarboxylate transporter receptor subunit TctC
MVENRPGAATIVGAEYVARSAPDGHTVLMSSGTTLTINPLLPDRLPYRPEDFAPVALITKLPFAFVVRQGLPTTIPDFVALAKSRPGQLNYGSNGPSSFNNITAAMLCEGLGIRMQEVTYRGDAPQLNDLMAGTLDVIIVGGSAGLTAHRSGKGRIIGWTGEQRVPATPEIPTFSELGPDMVSQTWFGLWCLRGLLQRRSRASTPRRCRRCRRPRCGTACSRRRSSSRVEHRATSPPSSAPRPIAGARYCGGSA